VLSTLYGGDYYSFVGRTRAPLKQAIWDSLRDVASGAPGRGRRFSYLRPVASAYARKRLDVNVDLRGRAPRVLDIGCGHGDLLIYLSSRGCEVLGIERDTRAAEAGRRQGVPVVIGAVESIALEKPFDVAILQHSLEHMEDPAAVLAAAARAVRAGGRLLIAVPNGDAEGLCRQRGGWGSLSFPLHFWFFDLESLRTMLMAAGFEISSVRYRTLWRDHLRYWRAEIASEQGIKAFARALGSTVTVVLRRRSGDIIRVEATRLP
jgi:SAM-dependent methyltransferase